MTVTVTGIGLTPGSRPRYDDGNMPADRISCCVVLVLCGAPLAAADLDGVQIHGFVSQGYYQTTQTGWYGDSDDGSFEFTEVALNASAQPIDGLRVGVQLMARDFGDAGDNRVEVDWAFADWRAAARSGIKVGRFKMPYGLYNESRDLDFDHATVFLPQVVYQPQLRDYTLALNGGMVYSGVDLGASGQLDGSLFGGSQNIREEGDLADYLTELGSGDSFSSITLDFMAGAELTWQTPVDGLRMRLSGVAFWNFESVGHSEGKEVPMQPGVYADLDITTEVDQFYSGIVSLEYQSSGLTLAAEYLREYGHSQTEVVAHPYTYVPTPGFPGTQLRVELPASTTQVTAYQLTEAMYAAASYRLLDKLELSVSRQLRFADRHQPGSSYDRTWAFAARYDIFSNWLVKAEWQQHSGNEIDTGNDNPESWNLFALKTTVDF